MQSLDPSQNYFELFGINPAYELDPERLHAEQQRLQAVYHPDRYVSASAHQKRLSVQMAAWINQAYETLRDPVKRAGYLLEINGMENTDASETTSDTEFLMEQIGLREELDACRSSEDAHECAEKIATRLARRAGELAAEFVEHFDGRDLEAAKLCRRKMQFIQRIQHQLSEFQFELEDS